MRFRRLGLYGLMAALTAVAAYAGASIAGPGGAVVGAVCGMVISAVGEIGRQWIDAKARLRELRDRVFLPRAADISTSELSPATLLVPEQATVPFIGRAQELFDLTNWCLHRNSDPLRVLIGPGGTGKTRLIRELAAELNGWDCEWVQFGQEANAIAAARHRRSLLIVDYAETRPRTDLAGLLWHLAWPPNRQGLRVLLIARAAGDWWAELRGRTQTVRERAILQNAKCVKMSTLADDNGSLEDHYRAALTAFSEKLSGLSIPESTPDLHRDASILMIHVTALVALLESGDPPADQQNETLSLLLDHEDRYWLRSAESFGLSGLSRTARCQAVAELCLSGAANVADAAELLKRVPELADASAASRYSVARWLQTLYPGEGAYQLSLLRPHLLAEHLVVRELFEDSEFASNALRDLPEDVALHALTMLGYAAEHEPHATALAYKAIHANPAKMIMPAVTAAVETGLPIDALLAGEIRPTAMDLFQLATLSRAIPLKAVSLDRTAVVVRKYFIEASGNELSHLERPTGDPEEIQRRQVELMELARILRYEHEQERALPASIREQLLEALRVQHDAMAINGGPAEAESISNEIAWMDSHALS